VCAGLPDVDPTEQPAHRPLFAESPCSAQPDLPIGIPRPSVLNPSRFYSSACCAGTRNIRRLFGFPRPCALLQVTVPISMKPNPSAAPVPVVQHRFFGPSPAASPDRFEKLRTKDLFLVLTTSKCLKRAPAAPVEIEAPTKIQRFKMIPPFRQSHRNSSGALTNRFVGISFFAENSRPRPYPWANHASQHVRGPPIVGKQAQNCPVFYRDKARDVCLAR